jgi:aryl-alcohol dehydrogenase-like predicted oxidoreductase
MRKRIFGKRCGFKVAPLSIGAMRLPDDGMDAVALIRTAIDRGMIYIDTSRGYGESELILGRAGSVKSGMKKYERKMTDIVKFK